MPLTHMIGFLGNLSVKKIENRSSFAEVEKNNEVGCFLNTVYMPSSYDIQI